MTTRNVPQDHWRTFFESFSREHHGWLVTIESSGRTLAENRPLDHIRAAGEIIDVRAGDFERLIRDVRDVAVYAADPAGNAIERIDIAGANETVTIRFPTAIPPEMVDGAVM